MSDYVLGIDPGATGALALFNCSQGILKEVTDMPNNQLTLTTGKKTKRVNVKALIAIFTRICDLVSPEDNLIVHIEKVQAFGKQSAPAAFNFGYAVGIPYTVAQCFDLEIILVPPQTWKRQFNLQASNKDEARLLVRDLFPQTKEILKYKKDVDRADAILLACFKP